MAVITAEGMIGKVKSVGKITSTVQLLSTVDRTNRIHVAIQGEKEDAFGLIEGFDSETQTLIVKQIPSEIKVAEEMDVVTSGFQVFFLKVYTLEQLKIEPDQYGLTQTAYVKPAANFYNIENVMVIEREMAIPDQKSEDADEAGTTEDEERADAEDEG